MRKVKEYLDKYYFSDGKTKTIEKSNGHLGVIGCWQYPEHIPNYDNYELGKTIIKDQISLSINNETLLIRMIIINNVSESLYSYLQTYEHIKRGEPDRHGYYARSTDEEIIKYLHSFYLRINKKVLRREKLNKINEKEI